MKNFTKRKQIPEFDMPGHKRIQEYAEMLGVSRQWVYDLLRRKKIQGVRIGGVLYIFIGKGGKK